MQFNFLERIINLLLNTNKRTYEKSVSLINMRKQLRTEHKLKLSVKKICYTFSQYLYPLYKQIINLTKLRFFKRQKKPLAQLFPFESKQHQSRTRLCKSIYLIFIHLPLRRIVSDCFIIYTFFLLFFWYKRKD